MKKYDLQERTIEFANTIIELSEKLPKTAIGKYLVGQISRSGVSTTLNYGEAQAAESRKDFVHKMKLSLKELRETNVCLKIIAKRNFINKDMLNGAIRENHELVSIFVKSISTARKNIIQTLQYSKNNLINKSSKTEV